MQPNEDIYYIPVNFTDAGRVLGLFELRNCIEAAALAAPTVGLCTLVAQHTPFSLTVKLILSLCLLVPVSYTHLPAHCIPRRRWYCK